MTDCWIILKLASLNHLRFLIRSAIYKRLVLLKMSILASIVAEALRKFRERGLAVAK
jgi:hypothetical protein